MERYDYFAAIKNDILDCINDNGMVVTTETGTKWNGNSTIYYLHVTA